MENTSFIEKRAFPRFPIKIPLSCVDNNSLKKIIAETHDISTHGLGIVIDSQLPAGTHLDICLEIPDNGEKISKKGKVAWLFMLEEKSFRIGIELEDPIKPIPLVLRTIKTQKHY